MKDFHTSINIRGVHIVIISIGKKNSIDYIEKQLNRVIYVMGLLVTLKESQKQINTANCQMVLPIDFITKQTL